MSDVSVSQIWDQTKQQQLMNSPAAAEIFSWVILNEWVNGLNLCVKQQWIKAQPPGGRKCVCHQSLHFFPSVFVLQNGSYTALWFAQTTLSIPGTTWSHRHKSVIIAPGIWRKGLSKYMVSFISCPVSGRPDCKSSPSWQHRLTPCSDGWFASLFWWI